MFKILERIPAGRMFRSRITRIAALVLLAAISASALIQFLAGSAGFSDGSAHADRDGSRPDDASVETYTVERGEFTESIDILGQIVFREKINISSKVSGRLSRIYIHEGDRVSAGRLIAEIERLPLEITLSQQRSELEIARRAHDLAKARYENALKGIEIKQKTIQKAAAELNDKLASYQNMDRILKNKIVLYDAGGLSESELKNLRTQHTTAYTAYQLAKSDLEIQQVGYRNEDIAAEGLKVPSSEKEKMELFKRINTKIERAELESARSRIAQAENNIQSTEILLKETYIRSPIDGLVAAKSMEAGEMVKPESVIATLINIAGVYIAMNVNEKEIRRIKTGQTVTFTVDAYGDETFKATIRRVTPVLDMKTRTVEIKAELRNPGYRLLPGMFARARISTGTPEKRILVPLSALAGKGDASGEVFLVRKDIAFKQKVRTGRESDGMIEILEGLRENDVIVSKGLGLVYDGMKLPSGAGTINPQQK